jgi:Tfp pilus assembly major pilin PilA
MPCSYLPYFTSHQGNSKQDETWSDVEKRSAASTMTIASITDDPRFKLARSLLVGGQCCNDASNKNEDDDDDNINTTKSSLSSPQEEAITIFAALLEECITINGDTSYNTAVCQFEYGNALFRAVVRRRPIYEEVVEEDRKIAATKTTTMMTNNNHEKRENMAAAAMKRSAFDDVTKDDDNEVEMERRCNKRVKHENGKLLTDQSMAIATNDNLKADPVNEDNGNDEDYDNGDDNDDDDDLDLAFEMMDTSWSIFLSLLVDDEQDNNVKSKLVIQTWVNDQLPRVLRGIGDLYSYRGEYVNAVDVYIRAMHYREEAWDQLEKTTSSSIDELRCKRLLVELYALISETLLYCPPGQDIIAHHPKMSGENKTILLSKSNNRLDIAQSYYEMARLGLEDVLYLYGKIMAKSTTTTATISTTTTATVDQQQEQQQMMDNMLKNEKEDIGYLVMTIVGIGNAILHKE